VPERPVERAPAPPAEPVPERPVERALEPPAERVPERPAERAAELRYSGTTGLCSRLGSSLAHEHRPSVLILLL